MHGANNTSKSSLRKAQMHRGLKKKKAGLECFCKKKKNPLEHARLLCSEDPELYMSVHRTTPFLCRWTRGQANKWFYLWLPSTFHKSSLMCASVVMGREAWPPNPPSDSQHPPPPCTPFAMSSSPRITCYCINSLLNPYLMNETVSHKLLTQLHKSKWLIRSVLHTLR